MELEPIDDDGLKTLPIKEHTLEKYRLIRYFTELFATAMKDKWRERMYLDLFAGPGVGRLESDGRLFKGSPLLALDVPHPFTRYIFCEANAESAAALEARCSVYRPPNAKIEVLCGDANELVASVEAAIPPGNDILGFLVADPYRVADLSLATIRTIVAAHRMDVLVLIPTGMEIQRNIDRLLRDSAALDRFLGMPDWRVEWDAARGQQPSLTARTWVVDALGRQMEKLGYIWAGPEDQVHSVGWHGTNYYDLAFFSQHELGIKFARKAKRGIDPQRSLF